MLATLQRLARDTRGASAIEFGIVALVFFVLVFGILIYGSYFATLSLVNHIAYESARATVTGLSDDERSTLAHARADDLIASFDGFLDGETVQVVAGPAGDGIYMVTVNHTFDGFGLMDGLSLLPLPPAAQTSSVRVSHGGY